METNGTNPTSPINRGATMEIGGRERHFVLDFYALMKLEQLTGESMVNGVQDWVNNASVTKICQLIWAICVHEDPSLTVEEVAKWLDFSIMTEIMTAIQGTVTGAMPDAAEVAPPNRAARRAAAKTAAKEAVSVGMTSGATDGTISDFPNPSSGT